MQSSTLRTFVLAAIVVVLAIAGEWFLAAVYGEDEVTCQQASLPASLPALPEASGLAASRRTRGLLWSVNDSGPAALVAMDDAGEVKARVQVSGATVTDWEDLSVGRCPQGTCLYIADIGDNAEQRTTVRLYRVPEPGTRDATTAPVEVFEARYPDGPHDAEAMFVTADATVYLVTKESPAGAVYRFPNLQPGKTLTLERVAMVPVPKVTDADASADGTWAAVRNGDQVVFYRIRELLDGDVEHGAVVQLGGYGEPQGEGVTFGDGGTVYLAGEGGGKRRPGTLLEMRCTLPSAA